VGLDKLKSTAEEMAKDTELEKTSLSTSDRGYTITGKVPEKADHPADKYPKELEILFKRIGRRGQYYIF
jgi:inorganic triphosphatase YgiF